MGLVDTDYGHSFRLLAAAGGDTVFAAEGDGFLARSADWRRTWSVMPTGTRAVAGGPEAEPAAGTSIRE